MKNLRCHIKMKLLFLSPVPYKQRSLLVMLVVLLMMGLPQLEAQNRFEVGAFVGSGYYFGDLNPSTPFRNAHPALGGLVRYNMTDRIAFKGGATMTELSGQYPVDGVLFPNAEGVSYSFSRTIVDVSAQMELNFMSYDHPFISKTRFTPYLCYGVATTIYKRYGDEMQNEENKTVFVLSLPFGVGAKYKLNSWIRVGAEWSFRKTFVDDLDDMGGSGVVHPDDPLGFGQKSLTHNNDWYSFTGITVTFSFSRRKTECHGGF